MSVTTPLYLAGTFLFNAPEDQAGFLEKGQVMFPKVWPGPPPHSLFPQLVRGCASASILDWCQVLRKPPSFPIFYPGADVGRRRFYYVTKCKYRQDIVAKKVWLTEWQDCMGIVKRAVTLLSELHSSGISVDLGNLGQRIREVTCPVTQSQRWWSHASLETDMFTKIMPFPPLDLV